MLDIIIVNYNVKYFLEQSLFAVQKAMLGIVGEIIVVDNASTDGSKDYLEKLFPAVRFIWMDENLGFAKANNIGLKYTKSKYVLYLNPDTIVPEDCFNICLNFMESHKNAGALGVKMIDGTGKFLRESKRAYPSIATSFFKLTGLSGLFPKSKFFAKYHLGHLDKNKNHEVEVLSGAFMLVRRELLLQIGGFDESFFMYGEDIELSYQIRKAGFKNYYCSDTCIIHFKGESTNRGSIKYVKLFYNAMIIFVEKHYKKFSARIFRFFLKIAIWFRAVVFIIGQIIQKIGLPLFDVLLLMLSFFIAITGWQYLIKPTYNFFSNEIGLILSFFILVIILANIYAGKYDTLQKRGSTFLATFVSGSLMLSFYAVLPEHLRFSRGIVVSGFVISTVLMHLFRMFCKKMQWIFLEEEQEKSTVVVAQTEEYNRVYSLMETIKKEKALLGRIAVDKMDSSCLTTLQKMNSFIRLYPVKEIIFCEGMLSFKEIIQHTSFQPFGIRMRISANGSKSIVGSDSSSSLGNTISENNNYNLSLPHFKRIKRLLDVLLASLIILGAFVLIFFVKKPLNLFKKAVLVFIGKKTWVGYSCGFSKTSGLPPLKDCIVCTNGFPALLELPLNEENYKLDELYAKSYAPQIDLQIIRKGIQWR